MLLQRCLHLTNGVVEQSLCRARAQRRCARRGSSDPAACALQSLQEQVRQHVTDYAERLQDAGLTWAQCGALLHLSPRTLRYWALERCGQTLGPAPVGRPLTSAPLPVRQAIIADLKLLGTGVGVPTLQQHFPAVARSELAGLRERFRAVCRRRYRQPARVLHWQTPGRVWAADFTEPSCPGGAVLPPLAGRYPYVLAVRDLASGMMLTWEPLLRLTEEVTQAALARLFALHGAPLILKVDNGSAFRADAFQDFLEAEEVIPLYSPPSCPGYNGAIEAAIGSLKNRTERHAHAQGHAGRWELTDLSAAESAANAGQPRRLNGRTPSAVWQARTPVEKLERVIFALTVERQRFQARSALGIAQEEVLDHWRDSAVDRQALERALVEHGHLLFTGRRIPLMNKTRKVPADV
jgi:transposase InsO family protein